MRIRHSGNQLLIASPAKLNLYLELVGKRDDGYHDLETVMTTVSLCDQLSFSLNGKTESTLDIHLPGNMESAPIPTGNDNLILAGLRQLRHWAAVHGSYDALPGMHIQLTKRIPSAAGLGGASSNAVAALLAGNHLWNLGLDRDQLASIAAELGSDVPFFLYGGLALCRGRGEIVEPMGNSCDWHFVVVKPQAGLATQDMFANVSLGHRLNASRPDAMLNGIAQGDRRQVADGLFNRFSQVAASIAGELVEVAGQFERLACIGHQLSGSGSSYFGVFDSHRQAAAAAAILQSRLPGMGVYKVMGTSAVVASQMKTAA